MGAVLVGVGGLGLAFFAALPYLTASTYLVSFFLSVFIAAILAQSYDWVGGHMGYLNLGHAAFFGIGAYAFGIALKAGQPLVFAFGAGAALAALFALAISYPFFRLRGAYFALATFGLVTLLELLALNLSRLTGGSEGLTIPTGYRLYHAYYVSLALLALLVTGTAWLARSPLGLALVAIREDEEVAGAFGVHAYAVKCLGLTASAAVAGLAGGVYCWYLTYIIPATVFGLDVALGPIVMAMLGGSGTVVGPLLGALVVDTIREALRFVVATQHFALTIYGAMLVVVGLFLPGGLAAPQRWRRLAAFVRGRTG
ncbi:MAG TPA: branched-chain amino acid ABC transporter permease [Methylomirabilota bacterium]|jgi:branched-chain amino acid transport system permease protein|nr:branched-chain amino acid ABC transporter permease [Methylomirabilota bacterium]